jgi:small subunit ribosomal protein S9
MPAKLVQQLGTGRRKTATARIFLRPGKGQITVNHRPIENYFVNESARAYVRQPLLAAEMADRFDILILANGGGISGQAGAARMGIARALIEFNT